jgi:hypothetical protein
MMERDIQVFRLHGTTLIDTGQSIKLNGVARQCGRPSTSSAGRMMRCDLAAPVGAH